MSKKREKKEGISIAGEIFALDAGVILGHSTILARPARQLADKLVGDAIFYFTMTPAPNFAGLRRSPIQQVYQWVRRVQHMTVLSET
jgi:hypothetical protein